jgi:hypothetical protein
MGIVLKELEEAESKGIRFRLLDGKVKAVFPASTRHQMAPVLERLRAKRDQVVALLIQRASLGLTTDCYIHGQGVPSWQRPTGRLVCRACHPSPHESDKQNSDLPAIPPGVRLRAWDPKQPPVVLERWSVVTDTHKFALATLEQLRAAMAGQNWLAGNWSVRELVDRLEQVGVSVELDEGVQVSGFKASITTE